MENTVPDQVDSIVAAADADDFATLPTCSKCMRGVPLDEISSKVSLAGKGSVICKSCHNVTTMLHKHFESMPDECNLMHQGGQVSFFQKCLEKRSSDNQVLKFSNLRTLLKQSLVTKVMSTTTKSSKGSFQPLSYWERKGYDVKLIKEKAENMDHPVLGTTYRLDIFHLSYERAEQQIEETLLSLDRTLKRKSLKEPKVKPAAKKSKGDKDAAPAEEPVEDPAEKEKKEETKAVLLNLVDLDSDSEDCKLVSWLNLLDFQVHNAPQEGCGNIGFWL